MLIKSFSSLGASEHFLRNNPLLDTPENPIGLHFLRPLLRLLASACPERPGNRSVDNQPLVQAKQAGNPV